MTSAPFDQMIGKTMQFCRRHSPTSHRCKGKAGDGTYGIGGATRAQQPGQCEDCDQYRPGDCSTHAPCILER